MNLGPKEIDWLPPGHRGAEPQAPDSPNSQSNHCSNTGNKGSFTTVPVHRVSSLFSSATQRICSKVTATIVWVLQRQNQQTHTHAHASVPCDVCWGFVTPTSGASTNMDPTAGSWLSHLTGVVGLWPQFSLSAGFFGLFGLLHVIPGLLPVHMASPCGLSSRKSRFIIWRLEAPGNTQSEPPVLLKTVVHTGTPAPLLHSVG